MSVIYPIGTDQGADIINILDNIATSLENIETKGANGRTADVIEGYMNQGVMFFDAQYTHRIIGEISKIYIDLLTNTAYRWFNDTWISISSSVEIASKTEAEQGIDNTKMMTPLRVAQAIASLETRIAALESAAQNTSSQWSVNSDGYLVLTGNTASESNDYLTITSDDINISDDYLILGNTNIPSTTVSNDYLTLTNSTASISNDYLTITSNDIDISNDYLQL